MGTDRSGDDRVCSGYGLDRAVVREEDEVKVKPQPAYRVWVENDILAWLQTKTRRELDSILRKLMKQEETRKEKS